jgi:hypothetical protein
VQLEFAPEDIKQRGDELLFVISPTARCINRRNASSLST